MHDIYTTSTRRIGRPCSSSIRITTSCLMAASSGRWSKASQVKSRYSTISGPSRPRSARPASGCSSSRTIAGSPVTMKAGLIRTRNSSLRET